MSGKEWSPRGVADKQIGAFSSYRITGIIWSLATLAVMGKFGSANAIGHAVA
jgi:hypothetical protein